MSPRRPTKEELDLWRRVTDTAEPLPNPGRLETGISKTGSSKPAPAITAAPQLEVKPFAIGDKLRGRAATEVSSLGLINAVTYPVRMDRKTFLRMKRGRMSPEARIDLHGMTGDQARAVLTRFLMRAHAAGRRFVLVITGKGRAGADSGPIPQRRGVIRQSLPIWVAQPPLAQIVLQITPAHIQHGGEGAYYVYLRRGG